MSQRYEPVATNDDNDHLQGPYTTHPIPDSPPPSFRSRASSPLSHTDPLISDADRELADTFDSPSDDEDSVDGHDNEGDRQRLINNTAANEGSGNVERPTEQVRRARSVTQLPVFTPRTGQTYGSGGANDGVFANLSAKPTRGEEIDEKPPTYEQAAADATPPYWETTILAPGMTSDEVYVDGLPVGSVFSFVWNAMISMSFQIVGFLLTYLLHTTHAAKNGSCAGLGITLVQFGFSMKSSGAARGPDPTAGGSGDFSGAPSDPNSHDFDPTAPADGGAGAVADVSAGISSSDWLAYILMIAGWFILIRSISDFLRARRHEQLVLQSPDRGLGVAVVAEGESDQTVV